MARTGHNRSMSPTRVSQPKSEKAKRWKVMKGDEGWKFPFQSHPPCLSALHANRWRVKVFFMISFFKNWFYQNAYLWHKCAPRGAHLCSLRNNFTAKESNMTNWAFAVLKNYRKLETTAFVKYLMFNFKFTKAVILTNWAHLKKSFLIISSYVTIW